MSDNIQIPHKEGPTVFPTIGLVPLAAAPGAPYAGMLALADGSGWDPLSLGVYHLVVYTGAAWIAATLSGHTH